MADNKQPIIIIKKKGGGHGGHHGGAWKIAYADFVTAMMAFFLVMWLMGSDEEIKAAVSEYFNDPGAGSPVPMAQDTGSRSQFNPFPNVEPSTGGRIMNLPTGKMSTQESLDPSLQDLIERLQDSISLDLGVTSISDEIQMVYDAEGLVLRISAKNFFDHGSKDINADLMPLLNIIGKTLENSKRIIRVIGHTDSSEKNIPGYSNAWMLSAARANEVVSYWQKTFNIPSKNFEVAGQSHFRQIASSDNPVGRAQNRRIEIIIPRSRFTNKNDR